MAMSLIQAGYGTMTDGRACFWRMERIIAEFLWVNLKSRRIGPPWSTKQA